MQSPVARETGTINMIVSLETDMSSCIVVPVGDDIGMCYSHFTTTGTSKTIVCGRVKFEHLILSETLWYGTTPHDPLKIRPSCTASSSLTLW